MKALLATVMMITLVSPAYAQFSGLNILPEQQENEAEDSGSADAKQEESDARPERTGPVAINSQFCAFSFFSDSDDRIDFSGTSGDKCFDTGKGADRFVLNSDDFPEGYYVYSDKGRSTFRLSNGPAEFFDVASTAREVRSGFGNDTLRFGIEYVDAEGRAFMMPETRVYPGGGDDLIIIGSGSRDALAPRNVSNLLVFPQEGSLGIEAGCGRYSDVDSIDFIVENAPSLSRISAVSNGCGVAMRNHAAPTTLKQDGGRTSLILRPDVAGRVLPLFEADVINGAALSAIMLNPSDGVYVNWQGAGTATIQIEASLPTTGGRAEIYNDGFVFAGVNAEVGAPEMSLVSSEIVEVNLSGMNVGDVELLMSAPEMRLDWTMSSLFPPRLKTPATADLKVVFDPNNEAHAALRPDLVPAESSEEGEQAEEENLPPPVEEPEVAETSNFSMERDEFGRTEMGIQAVLAGRPVDTVPQFTEQGMREMVNGQVTTGLIELNLRSRVGGCEVLRIWEADERLRVESECGLPQKVSAAGASRIEFIAGDRSINWDIKDIRLGNINILP